jgi:iron complex outermembrane recepter protein
MSRFTWLFVVLSFFSLPSSAEVFRGAVRLSDGTPLAGATLRVAGQTALSDSNGSFSLDIDPPATIEVSHEWIGTRRIVVSTAADARILAIDAVAPLRADVVVEARDADVLAPLSESSIDRRELERFDHGQDVPQLLARTPSVNSYADAGIGGSGYSSFSLRGIDQKRVNITLDGIPLNDPAENVLYFANFTDFAASMSSISVQRGIGITPGGAASYAGSVDFNSVRPLDFAGLDATIASGSFGTQRGSVAYSTGELDRGLALYGRLSVNATDGYREHSGVQQESLFGVIEKRHASSLWRFVGFSGHVQNELAYYAVDEATLEENRRFNPFQPEEVDDFRQHFAMMQYARPLGGAALEGSIYYNAADGWFDLWSDPAERDAILRFGIDQQMAGAVGALHFNAGGWRMSAGTHLQYFATDHTLDVEPSRVYGNRTTKREEALSIKAAREAGAWSVWTDLQVRHPSFDYDGSVDLDTIDWFFANPKVGISRRITETLSAYVTAGRVEREPTRTDLLLGEDDVTAFRSLEDVRPEEAIDVESGVRFRGNRLTVDANVYLMELRDEIQATGEINELGLAIRRNVDRSHRRGLELDAAYVITPRVRLTHASSFSRNRIDVWRQSFDVYDAAGNFTDSVVREFRNVRPLLTPEVIVNQGIEMDLPRGVRTALSARYVGESQLDNTGSSDRVAPSYTTFDFDGSVPFATTTAGTARLRVVVNNLTDEKPLPSGYSYAYLVRDGVEREEGISYFYPAAGRSFLLMLEFAR